MFGKSKNFKICSPDHLFWLKFAPELQNHRDWRYRFLMFFVSSKMAAIIRLKMDKNGIFDRKMAAVSEETKK